MNIPVLHKNKKQKFKAPYNHIQFFLSNCCFANFYKKRETRSFDYFVEFPFYVRSDTVSDLSFFNWWCVLNTKPQLEKMILRFCWLFVVTFLVCFTGKTPRWTGLASTNVFGFQSLIWICKWLMILIMGNKPFLRRLKRWTLDNMIGSNKKPPYF